MKRTDIASLAAMMLVLAGCGFKAPEPARAPPPAAPEPPLSSLAVTLTLPARDVAEKLNAATADRLAHIRGQQVKCGIGRCRLNLDAVRTEPASIRASGDALEIALPFSVNAELSLPGSFSFVHAKANAMGLAETRTTATLDPDWRIRPHTTGSVQLGDSHLRIGPAVTNIRDVWNDNDEMLSKPLFKMMDAQIARSVREGPQIARLWAKAFAPIKVSKKPVAWLMLSPERLRVGRLTTQNGDFVLPLTVDSRARVIVQDDPPQIAPARLPPPAPLQSRDDRFVFIVPVLLPYDRAAALAMDSLRKKPLHLAGMSVRFEDLQILPSATDVIIAARFCADQSWDTFHWFSACGVGYLRGVPAFDAATSTIRIRNVHYDVATESVILGAIRALAGPGLGRELERRLVFHAAKDIGKLETQIAAALAKPQGRDLVVAGQVESFGPPSLSWTKDGFLASFSAQGRVRTAVHL